MRKYTLLAVVLLIVIACSKDKVETKPSIKITSVSSEFVPIGSDLNIEMEFADKEGDISNKMFVKKIRTNSKVLPTLPDTFYLPMPEFTVTSRGTIKLILDYNFHLVSAINPGNPPNAENDSLIFKFALTDIAGNTSDTVSTNRIVISRN